MSAHRTVYARVLAMHVAIPDLKKKREKMDSRQYYNK